MKAQATHDKPKTEADKPQSETETAHRSGQFGADKPGYGKTPSKPERPADKAPNTKGPEYEEGGQYPGKRQEGK